MRARALRVFTKKLFRDIKTSRWQFAAVVLLVVIGMVLFTGLYSSFQNLWKSIDGPYESLNFAEFTVKVYGAPFNIVERIRPINGVKSLVGRTNLEVPMTMPSMEDQFLTARVITVPRDHHPEVNDVQVMEGAYFSPNADNETLVEKFFADYHGLKIGDTVRLISRGNQFDLAVKGIVISPEYLWPAKNVRDHMPTVLRTWGVFFLPEDEANRILNLNNTINEVAVTTINQSVRDEAINKVKTILEPYGIAEVVPRENQASDRQIRLLIGSLGLLGPIFSGFFLAVATIATYVLLTRMVSAQHVQIGTMRALGYRRLQILLYYLSFASVVWFTSSIIGIVLGQISSIYLTNLFASRISLPIVLTEFQWPVQVLGSLLALGFLMIAAVAPAFSAANLKPAEAMRPKTPKIGRVVRVDSLFFLKRASSSWKMSLRNLSRSKRRSAAAVLGIMLATSLVVSTSSFLDSFDYLFKVMYEDIAAYDLKVSFIQPQPLSVMKASENLSGIVAVEPIIQIPYHIQHNGKEYSVMITAFEGNSTLYRLYTITGQLTTVDPEGILLSRLLKDKLRVDVNDSLTLHFFNSTNNVKVAGFVNWSFGDAAFLSLEKAQAVTGFGDAINGLLVKADSQAQETVKQGLFKLPAVSGIETISQQKQDNIEMLKLFNTFIWSIFAFGVLMAFAVVFNTVSLNILERSRELATMRTLGVTMRRITSLVLLENGVLGLLGVALGLPLGNYLAKFIFGFFTSDLFVLEAVTYVSTYILGVVVIFVVLVVSCVPGLRYVRRLNLARVVKEQSN